LDKSKEKTTGGENSTQVGKKPFFPSTNRGVLGVFWGGGQGKKKKLFFGAKGGTPSFLGFGGMKKERPK